MELIGTREEVAVLLRTWVEEPADVREQVAIAVRAIMKRERLRRNARVFQSLSAEERRALDAILPPAGTARTRRGAAAKPSPTPA